jgi:DNA-binding Lrp family transcriptional regulator
VHLSSLRRNDPDQVRWVGVAASQPGLARRTPHEIAVLYLVRATGGGKAALPARRLFAGLQAAILKACGGRAMTPFFVQIKCELGKAYQVANALAEAELASEIYSTAGDYDLLAKFYVDSATDIGHFVNEKIQTLPGIKDTYTIITFKAFQG